MEGLNLVVKSACECSLFRGIKLINEGPSISHLFHANDVIFVGEWTDDSTENLTWIPKCFHIASALEVNLLKRRLFGLGIPNSELQHMASILGCCDGNFPFPYLGVPVSANMALKKALETHHS